MNESMRHQVWKVELALFVELKRVCDKYNLRVFATAGTLLGAIRHQGFIPWDDDMDFFMTRPEYEKLCAVAPAEFKKPYFWQSTYTDKIFRVHSQLRNSNTTALVTSDYGTKFNKGIFIDIFILDAWPEKERAQKKLLSKTRRISRCLSRLNIHRHNSGNAVMDLLKDVLRYPYALLISALGGKKKIFKRYEAALLNTYNKGDFTYLRDITFATDKDWLYKKDWFDQMEMRPFEDAKIPCPVNYHEILQTVYGADYMTPKHLPTAHGGTFFDVNNSYLTYEKLKKKQFNKLFADNEVEKKTN